MALCLGRARSGGAENPRREEGQVCVSEHHPVPREGSAALVLRVPPECPEGFEGGEGGGGRYTCPTMGSLRPGLSTHTWPVLFLS